MSVVGNPINWLKVRRRIGNASWLSDMVALRKLISVCSRCEYKFPWRWKQKLHYAEFTPFHGEGLCDGCRHEGVVTLYRSKDDPWFETCERQASIAAAIDRQDQMFRDGRRS
jgi:hypothetical protein